MPIGHRRLFSGEASPQAESVWSRRTLAGDSALPPCRALVSAAAPWRSHGTWWCCPRAWSARVWAPFLLAVRVQALGRDPPVLHCCGLCGVTCSDARFLYRPVSDLGERGGSSGSPVCPVLSDSHGGGAGGGCCHSVDVETDFAGATQECGVRKRSAWVF